MEYMASYDGWLMINNPEKYSERQEKVKFEDFKNKILEKIKVKKCQKLKTS
jgi:hypothetical protein